jgi:hypothetical protein
MFAGAIKMWGRFDAYLSDDLTEFRRTTLTGSQFRIDCAHQVSHNGATGMNGSLVTLIYSGVGGGGGGSSVPVSPWAILALFLVISFAGYKMLRRTTMTPV